MPALLCLVLLNSSHAQDRKSGVESADSELAALSGDDSFAATVRYDIPLLNEDGSPSGRSEELVMNLSWSTVHVTSDAGQVPGDGSLSDEAVDQLAALQTSDHEIPVFELSGRSPSDEGSSGIWGKIRNRLKLRGVTLQKETVDREVSAALALREKGTQPSLFALPKGEEFKLGVVQMIWKGSSASFSWFTRPGVSPALATGMVAYTAFMNFVHTFYRPVFNRAFKKSLIGSGSASAREIFWKRQTYSLLLTELQRGLTGPIGTAASIFTVQGQMQIFSYLAIIGVADSWYGTAKQQLVGDNRKLDSRLTFIGSMLMAPLSIIEASGLSHSILLDLKVYQVTWNTVAMLGVYAALTVAVKKYPEQVKGLLERLSLDRGLVKARSLVTEIKGTPTFRHCRELLKSVESAVPATLPFLSAFN
ncbi:MAG: hypothetical protein H7222_17930 [Methylotenera sp.]|nr:hypothetical protein [Oligoflexia bacterium]